jgi:hypothetical protein
MTKEEILENFDALYVAGWAFPPEDALEALVDWISRRQAGLSDEDCALLMAAGSALYTSAIEVRRNTRKSIRPEPVVLDL